MKKNLPLILSIIGLFLSVVIIGIPICIVSIVMGAKRRKDNPKRNTIAIVISALGLLMGIVSLSPSDSTKPETDSKAVVEEKVKEEPKVETAKEETEDVEEEVIEENKDYYTIGEKAEYKGFEMTMLGYTESEGGSWGEPQDGNIFLFPEFEIYNGTKDEVTISTLMGSFEVYCDDYKMESSTSAMTYSSAEKMKDIGGSVAPGKKNKGIYNTLEVPKDWEKIEILYFDNMFKDATFTFVIEK